jgi:nucleotide-binding universal stress UspA family protein
VLPPASAQSQRGMTLARGADTIAFATADWLRKRTAMKQPTLVVPLDGSDTAEAALPYAEALARLEGASLMLLSVADPAEEGFFGLSADDRASYDRARRAALTSYLKTAAQPMVDRGVAVTTSVATGKVADRILALASRTAAAAIVVASHGRGGVKRLVLGSVADKVMRMSLRPVLLIGAGKGAHRRKTVRFRRLLVPLDGSPLAEQALQPAGRLAAASGAAITLVRVEPWHLTWLAPGYEYVPASAGTEEDIQRAAIEYLQPLRARLPASVAVDLAVLRGGPAEQLAAYEAEHAVDLIVMTTHGRGGLRRLAVGSTADRLVRAGLPILLTRPATRVK